MKRMAILFIMFYIQFTGFLDSQEYKFKGLNICISHSFAKDINYIRELGIHAVRIEIPWQLIEPGQDNFDWSKTDEIIKLSRENDIEILFTLRSISSWATKIQAMKKDIYHNASSPKNIKDWELFVRAFVLRYRFSGINYEIENEVNMPDFWKGTLDEYLDLLKSSYKTIKENNPEAQVLCSAMGCGIVKNIKDKTAQNKVMNYNDGWQLPILSTNAFDIVNVHDYYFPEDIIANGWTFKSYLKHIYDLMKDANVLSRPIWITEIGYVSHPAKAGFRIDKGSPDKQAEWLKFSYDIAIESGVDKIFWLFLRDANISAGYFDTMGLMDAKNNIRPAWYVLKKLEKN